jgi:hypothetical protein
MTMFQKIAGGVVIAMVATALLLPGRQTVPVLKAGKQLATGVISTAEGTST